MTRLHFISGLPRSGSTLLAAILNQNPRFRAGMSSPVFPIFNAALSAMGGGNEFAVFLQDDQKRRILNGILDGYHGGPDAAPVAFDTNRMWTSRLPALIALRPDVRMIVCVRNPGWILDSIETLLRRNALDTTRLFGSDAERLSVFARADALAGRTRLIGGAYIAFKEAFYSREARSTLILDYDTLVRQPADAMALVYQFLDEPPFAHDFEDVHFQAEDFDGFLLARDLHTVKGRVEARTRATILPPELFRRFEQMDFWTAGQSLAYRITAAKPKGTGG